MTRCRLSFLERHFAIERFYICRLIIIEDIVSLLHYSVRYSFIVTRMSRLLARISQVLFRYFFSTFRETLSFGFINFHQVDRVDLPFPHARYFSANFSRTIILRQSSRRFSPRRMQKAVYLPAAAFIDGDFITPLRRFNDVYMLSFLRLMLRRYFVYFGWRIFR